MRRTSEKSKWFIEKLKMTMSALDFVLLSPSFSVSRIHSRLMHLCRKKRIDVKVQKVLVRVNLRAGRNHKSRNNCSLFIKVARFYLLIARHWLSRKRCWNMLQLSRTCGDSEFRFWHHWQWIMRFSERTEFRSSSENTKNSLSTF